jgi:hypothetical protein
MSTRWNRANPERAKEIAKKSYHIDPFRAKMRDFVPEPEINRAIEAWKIFDGVCQGCGTRCSTKFDTDHDHITKKFRGILGSKCNKTLGLMKDDIERLLALAQYLVRI